MQHITQAKKQFLKQESKFISTLNHFDWQRQSPRQEQNEVSLMGTTNASIQRNSIPRVSSPNLMTQNTTLYSNPTQWSLSARPSLSNLSSPKLVKTGRKIPSTNQFFKDTNKEEEQEEQEQPTKPILPSSPKRNEITHTNIVRKIPFPTSSRSLKRTKTPNQKKQPSLSEMFLEDELQMSIIESADSLPSNQLFTQPKYNTLIQTTEEDIQLDIQKLASIYNNSGINIIKSSSPRAQRNIVKRIPQNQNTVRQEYYSSASIIPAGSNSQQYQQLDSSGRMNLSSNRMDCSSLTTIQEQIERPSLKQQASSRFQQLIHSIVPRKKITPLDESTTSSFSDIPLSINQISQIIEDQRQKNSPNFAQNNNKSSLYIRSESLRKSQLLLRSKKITSRSPFHRNQQLFESMAGTTQYGKFAQRIAFNLINLQSLYSNDEFLFRQIQKQLSFRHSALTDVFVLNAKKMQLSYRVEDIEKQLLKVESDYFAQRKRFGLNSITSDSYISPEKLNEELTILDEKLESMCLMRIQSKVRNEFDQLSNSRDNVTDCLNIMIRKGKTEPIEMTKAYRCNYLDQKLNYLPERFAYKSNNLGDFPLISKESLMISEQIETRIADLNGFNKELNNPYKAKKDQHIN